MVSVETPPTDVLPRCPGCGEDVFKRYDYRWLRAGGRLEITSCMFCGVVVSEEQIRETHHKAPLHVRQWRAGLRRYLTQAQHASAREYGRREEERDPGWWELDRYHQVEEVIANLPHTPTDRLTDPDMDDPAHDNAELCLTTEDTPVENAMNVILFDERDVDEDEEPPDTEVMMVDTVDLPDLDRLDFSKPPTGPQLAEIRRLVGVLNRMVCGTDGTEIITEDIDDILDRDEPFGGWNMDEASEAIDILIAQIDTERNKRNAYH